jgi:amino acid adenylation domain-containing protein
MPESSRRQDIAIVGIGCRLPGGADTPERFWRLLAEGVDAISEVPPERFDIDEVFDPDPARPGKVYSRWGGFIEKVDEFDADFFGISPREARRMDPQHRLLLEVVWEALEDGGQVAERIAGTSTGVFIGISTHDYADLHLRPGLRNGLDAHVNIGNALCAAANRVSYLLDLRGPSFAVESACSSSLTAVHLACRSLRGGESEMAIAGGVNLVLSPELTIGFCKASMISPDGRCRAFDARANGYVRSEGAGVVFLKTLDRALEENDPIYAVIRGTAVNEDGRTAGISLPSGESQEELLRHALRDAGLPATAVQYVEAHGTGTAAGDPVEAGALGRVYGAGRSPDDPCLIGSAKTNVGHLEAGAGITGLIKAALALRHRRIPASLHFEQANPEIPLDDLGLRVATRLEPWPERPGPAIAGVNAFGFGGSNAHVLLEEPPRREIGARRGDPRALLLPVSARSPEALAELAERHARHLSAETTIPAEDVCFTAARRRSHHEHRLAVVGGDRAELIEALEAFTRGEERNDVKVGRARHGAEPRLVFAFSGMGPQWWGMGRQLLAEEPVYRETLEQCDRLLEPIAGWSLIEELGRDEHTSRIGAADLAHVANFSVQIGLAALWRSWGIEPDAIVGHSSGEIAAACVAGALTLPDAIHLAYHRGRLQHTLAGTGGMLAATISPEEAAGLLVGLEDRVSLAAVNSPASVTLSGEVEALKGIAAELERRATFCRFLQVDVPYHAPQMAAIRDELIDLLSELEPSDVSIPLVSSVGGGPVAGSELDGAYWWDNVRSPVRFAPAIDRLTEDGYEHFLEVGPHPVLSLYIDECLAHRDCAATVLSTLRRKEPERSTMLRSLAALHVEGREVDWSAVYPEGRCVSIPTYAWQRERYWIETAPGADVTSPGVDTGHPLLGRRLHSPDPDWQVNLEDPRTEYLDEHVVQGSAVFPGAGYVEMMLAATRDMSEGESILLEKVDFRRLLFLDPGRSCLLRLHYRDHDSSLEIHGAAPTERPTWTLHATGRVRRQAEFGQNGHFDIAGAYERCAEEMPVEEHHAALTARGFDYGEAFRGLREIRFGPEEAIARIGFPSGAERSTGAYNVHPALLDAAFQLLAVAGFRQREEAATLPLFPVGIERVAFHSVPGDGFLAHVRVGRSGTAMLEGDVQLVDESGARMVTFEGLRMKLLDEVRSQPHAQDEDGWFYELAWEELSVDTQANGSAPRLRPVREVRDSIVSAGPGPEEIPAVRRYHRVVQPALDRIAAGFAALALEELGWDPRGHAELDPDTLADRIGVVPAHRRLLPGLVRMAGRHRQAGDARVEFASEPLHALLDDLIANEPGYSAECELVRRGGTRLPKILRGHEDALEVLFAGESLEVLSQMYHSSPACRTYHDLLGRTASTLLSEDAAAGNVRILEIGAGTGAASAAVLQALPSSVEYVFTDISPFFLAQARERFREDSRLRYSILDIERDPVEQGYEAHSFDLVLASNVLHATADLTASLSHVKRLLRPGGVIAILELTRDWDWCNLVFGLLEGWWRFADHAIRPSSALLRPEHWCALLEAGGYEEVTSLFGEEGTGEHLQGVVLARASAAATAFAEEPEEEEEPHSRTWLLLADRGGTAARLAGALRQRGDRCLLAYAADRFRRLGHDLFEVPLSTTEALDGILEESRGPDGTRAAIVHLWSLDAPRGDSVSTAELMGSQRLGSASLLEIFRSVGASREPAVWVVTAGAQALDGSDDVPRVSQSPLWGLGRVAASEYGSERCRLVDLSGIPGDDEITSLAALLVAGEELSEPEVALRGRRILVRRLTRVARENSSGPGRPRSLSPGTANFNLEIGTPGALENLRLHERSPGAPGPGEIAIRVLASGLNFREVLQALGMLPPAALRIDGDVGGLGVECAGVVISCGEGVDGVHPGDEVIAFASGAHGSRVTARAHLVVPKPPTMSFAEGASVVNAFVTARYALRHVARLEEGDRVLIHSASGGVGLAAIQMCRAAGAEIFATAGTSAKRDYLASLGVDHVSDSRSLSFADEVRARTGGEGVDVVLNSLTGEAMRASLDLLRPYGRFVELGKRDIYENRRIDLLPFQRNLSYAAIDLMRLALDRPNFANRLIREVVDEIAEGTWKLLPITEFDLADAEHAFRFMAQARHTGKVVLTHEESEYPVYPATDSPPYRADATYLITGGLGGFGLAAAEWLVARGAENLVLMSRTGVPKGDASALERLRESGARVSVLRGNVGDEQDVERILDLVRREMPPLKGVIHAAMVLDDDVLVRLDEARLFEVLAPKVAGAWNLHRQTRSDQLDFFLLFSSVASVIGHPLQGNYAAANAFLDTFAAYRRSLGLPALAISWGALAGVGYVSRHPEVSQYLERSGFASFTTDEAFAAMEDLIGSDLPHVMAARLDWRAWAERNPSAAASRRFSRVVVADEPKDIGPHSGSPDSPIARLRATEPELRRAALAEYLSRKIARVLGGDPTKIDLERPLIDLGFDSLMAVELVTAFKSELSVALPVVKVLQGITGEELAEILMEQMALGAPARDSTRMEDMVAAGGPEAAAPVGKGDVPQREAAALGAEAATSGADAAAAPGAEAIFPAAEAATPGADAATPGADAVTSGANAVTSGANAATSGANAATSVADAATSVADAATSGANAAISAADAATSGANAVTSGANAATPGADAAAPSRRDVARGTHPSTRKPAAPARVPLSFEQRRFWFLDSLSPANPAYNLYVAGRLRGTLDERALERSVAEVVRRHPALRAAFDAPDGEPLQSIAPPASLRLTVHDLRTCSPEEREVELRRLATAALREPFDLGRPPLLRATLLRLDDDEHVLLLVVHHIACDAWGVTLIVREVMALYDDFAQGRKPSLPMPAASYADYARAQAAALTDQLAAEQLAYWTNRLAGASPALDLPTDRERPPVPTFRGGHVPFELSEDLSDSLRDLARREGVTLFTVLLTAFQALLSRYGGQEDLCIGTPVATRNRPGTEDLIGCCMNTLVLRGDLSGNPTLRELLRRSKETSLEALQNQDVPFERVVEALRPPRDASHSPLFQAMLILHNLRWPDLRMGTLDIHPLIVETGSSALDLTLLVDTGARLRGTLEYSADLFDPETAIRLVEHLRILLGSMVRDPERRLSDISLMDDDERRRVLVDWNDTATDFGEPCGVHELVSAQAARTPDSTAIVADGEWLTYREVSARAKLLARRLNRLGIGPERVVATLLEPSPELPVALLGILEAGGAFLALDPTHPPARLARMLDAAGAEVVITHERMPGGFTEGRVAVVLAEKTEDFSPNDSPARPDGDVDSDHLAYVAFTSGSTGEPNPVMVPHRALWNQLRWRQLRFPLGEADAVLQRTPIGFDPAIWEFFAPLAAGARLVVPSRAAASDVADLVRWIGRHQVTTIQVVPSLLGALLEHPDLERAGSLRRILCGGEPLPLELRDACFTRLPRVELYNLYGPTETTIDATCWRCEPDDPRPSAPIGRPIANSRIYVLDEHLRPAPVGVPGEIYIGGAGVARGYMNRPEPTAARFLPDPFAGRSDARLYRTGDRGRWRFDGTLEFQGRLDDQVKVLGYRVEPGEVEAAMRGHPDVRDAMVAVRRDRMSGNGLVAWIVPTPERTPPGEELRAWLEARLPPYMVPVRIGVTHTVPRLPNGKLDRRAAISDFPEIEPERSHVPPRDGFELRLVRLWETLFDSGPIGITDDFFDLGGHSLLAMRLQARLRAELGRELPVATLIRHGSIDRLARLLRAQSDPLATAPVVPIQPNGSRPPLFFVHPAGGSILAYLDLARGMDQEQPFYGIQARGLAAGEEPQARIEEMAADYVQAIREFRAEGPFLLGGWSLGGVLAFEMARQLDDLGRRPELVVLVDSWPAARNGPAADREREALVEGYAQSLGLPPGPLLEAVADLSSVEPDAQLALLLERAGTADLDLTDADPEDVRRRLRILAAHLAAMRDYVPRPYSGPVVLFQAAESLSGQAAAAARTWNVLTGGRAEVHTLPGTHHTLLREPGARFLAKELAACLDGLPLLTH